MKRNKHSRQQTVSLLPSLRARRLTFGFLIVMGVLLAGALMFYHPKLSICALAALPFLGAVIPEAEFQEKVLGGIEAQRKGLGDQAESFRLLKEESTKSIKELKDEANAVREKLLAVERHQSTVRSYRPARPGHVSDDAAQYIACLSLKEHFKRGVLSSSLNGAVERILGKTALSSTDIPLPTGYAGEVVELVSAYGAARKYGTVYPLGNGVVNLPRLKTDTTFTLLTQSAAITEKSPATEWVTFTPEKFGGLVRVPTELDEDSLFALGQFIARYSARNLARSEDWNYFCSTGAASGVNGTQKGLAGPIASAQTYTLGKYKVSGTLGSPSEFTLAHIRSIRSVVDAPALSFGAYYLHPSFEQHLSGLNTAGDKPYQANGVNGASLDGFPIRWVDVMPVWTTADAVSIVHILFGDLSFHYLGVRRGPQFDTSSEAGFATDEILVRGMERFTTGLMAGGAMSGLATYSS